MIRPTLFVGLGTTGTKILKSLRQLLFEEYGHAGLPVFRYISIETDNDEKGQDPGLQLTNQMQDYERITVVSATIASTAPIQLKLTPGHPRYNRHLADWLNPELLKVETHGFETGAKNIRMAGRLCLWENWLQMEQKVTSARDAIIAQGTTDKTKDILTRYYQAKSRQIPRGKLIDDGAVNVYIVGSLCGGSCSGMMIDVAYFFRALFAGPDASKVYGMFTMYDKDQATGQAADTTVRSANCYASLLELNYYNHTDTTYDITFPTGRKVEKMRRKPFDYATFVSRSSRTPNIKHVLTGGDFDEDGLNLMVALNLFAESAGDTDGQKEAIRTDWEGYEGVWGLKPVIKGEIPLMVKYMASFGLTAVWYPKYRIASASACLVSQGLCKVLLGKHVPQATILTEAANQWQTILRPNMDILTNPKGQPPLRSRIESELNLVTSGTQLQKTMETSSTQDAFRQKFDQGGEYSELIKIQVPDCEDAFRNAIEEALNNRLAAIDFQGESGLGDVQAFFEALDKEIEKTIQSLPDRLPPLDLKLDWTPIRRAENNLWTKLIGLREQAIDECRKELIKKYRAVILGDKEAAYQKVRNFFLRPVLQRVRAELGFGVQPPDADAPNSARTIKQRLDQMVSNLNTCVKTFQNNYETASNLRNSASVKIVTDNPQNKIEIDAEALRAEIANMDTLSTLLCQKTMGAFLAEGHEAITLRMTETYRSLSLEQIPVKDVVTKARNILEAGGEENEIISMASRSNPYQTFHSNYVPAELDTPPKIICGDDSTKDALTDLRDSLSSKGPHFPRLGASSVDHLLFFYEEEAGFALDDLDAHAMLEQNFLKKPGIYGHLTHQDPDRIDLGLHQKSERLARWCKGLARLVPEICNRIGSKVFEGVFRLDNGRYVFEYYVDGLPQTLALYDDIDGIKRLSCRENSDAYRAFIGDIQSKFAQLSRPNITEVVRQLLWTVADLDQRGRLSDFYGKFLNEVYANSELTSETGADSGAEPDEPFFPPTPQTRVDIPPDEPTPNQHVEAERSTNATVDADGYEEIPSEDAEYNAGTFTEMKSENSSEHYGESTSQDPMSQRGTADADGDKRVWAESEPHAEPNPTDEPAAEVRDEEPFTEQGQRAEGTPATHEQKKQTQPPKEFSVADFDVKQLMRRGNTRKKE